MNDHVHPLFRDILNSFLPVNPEPKPNPERMQKRCPDCFGTGRVDFFDGETPMTCKLCGGEGMLP